MRYLIVSDLHSNIEALEAVAAAAEGQYERALCCGDLLGYGADPNPVVDWARAHLAETVRGNHDKACVADEPLDWFNPAAQKAAMWTSQALTETNREFVKALPRGPVRLDGFELVHGSPFDEDEYVTGAADAAGAFQYVESRVAFFGHTHVQGGYIWNHSRVEYLPRVAPGESRLVVEIDPSCAYLVNPGSVGQPRDGDPRAAFVIWDSSALTVAFCRAEYDIASTQRKMRRAGLPALLADRLSAGR